MGIGVASDYVTFIRLPRAAPMRDKCSGERQTILRQRKSFYPSPPIKSKRDDNGFGSIKGRYG
jgi:hypothetical protein